MKAPEFWQRDRHSLASAMMAPFGWAYGAAGILRQTFANPSQVSVPVICVGNVVAGGAGKTPVALNIASKLQIRDKAVCFLSRGYGGSEIGPHRVIGETDLAERVGDEPLLLSKQAPTWVARDRIKGAKAASQNADVIIMDDGYQNPSLIKNCSLLVVDGRYGFGNGRLMPAGPLRESVGRALARADGVVILGPDEAGIAAVILSDAPDVPVLNAQVIPGPEMKTVAGKKIIAFAGIGQPDKFFKTLSDGGCDLVSTHSFADHHPYTMGEIDRLRAESENNDSLLVTTEKDLVRIPAEQRHGIEVLTITLQWEDEAAMDALLDRLF
jgi:tetraacyldisaccharide 4'-kinase